MTTDQHPDADPAGVRLGFAVKVLGAGGLSSHDARRWQSGPHLRVSLERLRAILAYLDDIDVRCYRMATSLAPYASHPELVQFRDQPRECVQELARAELEVQAELFDGMGLGPESVVVLHVGGAAGGRDAALDRFERGFAGLSDAAQARVVVENGAIDVMLEAKAKDLALVRLRDQLARRGFGWRDGALVAPVAA